MKIVIAGGKGGLGQRLSKHFVEAGHSVTVLTRRPQPNVNVTEVLWDGKTLGQWTSYLQDAVVINLAGQLVDRRPTKRNIELLRSSRVDATNVLKSALVTNRWTTPLWLQMSTTAIYGDCGELILDETALPVNPLPQMTGVAQPWEEAFAGTPAERSVIMRTGIVLDNNMPAMDRLTLMVKRGLGGRVASGKQWITWIHVDDFINAVDFAIANHELQGVVHFASPNPVRNVELMAGLRHELHRRWAPPTPAFAVRLGAPFMGSDADLALTGRRCIPKKLLAAGFVFEHPTIDSALHDLLSPSLSPLSLINKEGARNAH